MHFMLIFMYFMQALVFYTLNVISFLQTKSQGVY